MPNDDAELVKAGVQGMVEGSLKPFSDLIAALFGPAASEAGLMLEDHVRYFRLRRQVRLCEKTGEFLTDAGVTPRAVPLKLLIPIIENASLEEDDDLQDMWARLLATAADPSSKAIEAMPSYLAVLRELSSNEVRFLNAWYETFVGNTPGVTEFSRAYITDRRFILAELLPIYNSSVVVTYQGVGSSHMEITVENLAAMLAMLVRHSLVAKFVDDESIVRIEPFASSVSDLTTYTLTDFGAMFIAACRGSQTVA
jgi:hypothetical protein